MATNYSQDGQTIEYTNDTGSDIASGDIVVVGSMLGLALVNIPDTETGTLLTEGVVKAPKVAAAVIAKGETVIWDSSENAFEDDQATPATGDVSGCCIAWESAGNGVEFVEVKLNVAPGTVAS